MFRVTLDRKQGKRRSGNTEGGGVDDTSLNKDLEGDEPGRGSNVGGTGDGRHGKRSRANRKDKKSEV